MKLILRIFFCVFAIATLLVSCDKTDQLPFYKSGTTPVLSTTSTALTPAAADSNNTILTLNWSFPAYSVDSANTLYTVEIDSTGKNFANAATKKVTGNLSASYTAKELNTILLSKGYAFNVPVDMDIRVISSYANNNQRLTSNVIKVRMTPYKIPPKVALPASGKLFIIGAATQGGWNNPVPTPAQEFAQIDETTFAGVFQLIGGQEFLILPVNGDWTNKFSVADKSLAGLSAGGDFGYNLSDNFPGPATSGLYKIVIDFQMGKFTVAPYTGALPSDLFIIGDATAGGWTNPVPVPSQKFTRLNSSIFEISLPLTGGKEYLLLPENGSWAHKFAVADKSVAGLSSGGDFGYDLGDNFPAPATSGNYKIVVNFATNKFTVTRQ